MDLRSQKRIASKLLKCGKTRVRIRSEKEAEEALTREDVRGLIRKGVIESIQKKGTTRANARKILQQKKKGRRKGIGKRKGKKGARMTSKDKWMKLIRSQRKFLTGLRETKRLDTKTCRKMLRMAKAGSFRSKKHLMFYMREKGILSAAEKVLVKPVKKPAVPKKAAKKTVKKPAAKPRAKVKK